jgi:hypothetical protein
MAAARPQRPDDARQDHSQDRGGPRVRSSLRLRSKHIEIDLRQVTPIVANDRRKVWQAMLAFAVRSPALAIDETPARAVPRRTAAESLGHRPWPAEERERFRAHWPYESPPRLALERFSWAGARCADTRTLGRQMVEAEGWLCFRQQKTRVAVAIPWKCPLPAWCAAFATDHARRARCAQGLDDLRRHGVRRPTLGEGHQPVVRREGARGRCAQGLHGARAQENRGIAIAEVEGTTHQIMS